MFQPQQVYVLSGQVQVPSLQNAHGTIYAVVANIGGKLAFTMYLDFGDVRLDKLL